ncbi:MAG: hypothetical protein GY842_05655, partial [bacterium]|nr:hypothetical protein [bacterium]
PDGVYIVSQQWDIEYVNPVIEREFGPVDGRKCYEYFHNRTVTCPWCKNAEVFAGKSVRWEWHSFKNNRDYDLFDTPFRNADGSVSKFEIFHDITRRKQAEEELAEHRNHLQELVEERSRQLEESRAQLRLSERLASVGTLAAGIAHEINNPIGGILLAAQYALASEGDPALTRKALTDVVDHAQRSRDIVHSVLRFSGEASVEKTAEHLNDVVRHAIDAARPYADQRGCIISHVLEANLPCVDMNPIEMELVVTNLIRNAAEAGAAETRLETRATADTILLIVSDNGAGVSPEQKQRLFDPFYTTRRSKGGTGLGLSISHGIILDHGGTIDISGEPGTGMTATVTLPQSATAPAGEIRDA